MSKENKNMTAQEFLNTEDKIKPSSFDNQMGNWTYTESQLTAFAERYHQSKLKLLGIVDVIERSEQLLFSPDDIERIVNEKSMFNGKQFRKMFEK